MTLEDRFGKQRVFPLERAGSCSRASRSRWCARRRPARPRRPARTASGSVAPPRAPGPGGAGQPDLRRGQARRRAGREDLGRRPARRRRGGRVPGGDRPPAGIVAEFAPGPGRRLGVLVDHLVTGSKESRIAAGVSSPHVLITGHPFVDIWQAVKPAAVGIAAWPQVPRGVPWKEGVLRALGWPRGHRRGLAADPARGPQLHRPGACSARQRRAPDRLRDRPGQRLGRSLVRTAWPVPVRAHPVRPRITASASSRPAG